MPYDIKYSRIKYKLFMINYIWSGLIIISIIVGIINGKIGDITDTATSSSMEAVKLCINLTGIMCFWMGIMKIAERSNLINLFAKVSRFFLKFLFPDIPKNHPALGAIVMNLTANFFGLGNAATPFGINAMTKLQELNPTKNTATNSMSMFLILNSASLQLIPATIIAIRSASGSQHPSEIIGTIWIASAFTAISGIIAVKILSRRQT